MRKIKFILILFLCLNCLAQNKQISYNLTSIPQALWSNPGADVQYKWFAGMPLLSGISASIGSSGFSAYDLFADKGLNFNTKIRNILSSVDRNDHISLNQQLEVISGGFKINDLFSTSYISFGLYQESDFLVYIPKDYVIFALDGNKNLIGKRFEIGDFNMRAEMLSVIHIGIHKKINDKLVVGARGKFYSSIFNISSTDNSGSINTIDGTNSVYSQAVSIDAKIETSGFPKNNIITEHDFMKNLFSSGNVGLGLDLGFTYYPKENLQFTGSIIDLGFIRHTNDATRYQLKGFYNYEGIANNLGTNSAVDPLEELKKAIPFDTLSTKYTTMRPLKFNTSVQYSFGQNQSTVCNCDREGESNNSYINSFGAQLFALITPKVPVAALTVYYKRNFSNILELKTTYTIDPYSAKNIGLGLSTNIANINLYIMADNLIQYKDLYKANSLSFQFGLNYIVRTKED